MMQTVELTSYEAHIPWCRTGSERRAVLVHHNFACTVIFHTFSLGTPLGDLYQSQYRHMNVGIPKDRFRHGVGLPMFPTPNAICNKAPFFLFLIRVIGAEEDSGFRSGEIWVYCEIEVKFSERREAGGGLWSGRAERMESCVRTPNRVLSGNASVFRG